ncbi:hypothetical protein AQ733_03180 [Burkholderia pseudomallei]|nr:hypothetical protein AQ728_06490 [Burkholderia pseudomallei]OMR96449.1 hypothetical protein AQ733_03180 [Burkholderia pseudomallei]OMS13145.1 hypothetical protein AQ735_02075 [Burkholderia pseudomallei]OMT70960.1 hypothetical protein AQ764_08945 [Burkholderia pseudomallei]OMT91627.1 hypothetical protein AQ766_08310 [Burkholderia pseudomallei]
MRISPRVGASSIDDPNNAADDSSYKILIDCNDLVKRFSVSLPKFIGRLNGCCVVPRKIEAEFGMAVVAQIVSSKRTNRRKENWDTWRRFSVVSQDDIESRYVEGRRTDVDQRVQPFPHLRRP